MLRVLGLRSVAASLACRSQAVAAASTAIAANPVVGGERDVYGRVRAALLDSQRIATRFSGPQAAALQTSLQASVDNLNERFRLAVVGNFNLGKSSLINALLGRNVSPEGSDITTLVVHRINYGADNHAVELVERNEIDVATDVAWLRDNAVELIDTPGVGASVAEHQAISLSSIPHCDLVLLVTNPTSLLSAAAEHRLMEMLGKHRSVIVVMNRLDQITSDAELQTLMSQARKNAAKFLHKDTPFVAVSAKLAKEGAAEKDPQTRDQLLARSRIGDLAGMLTALLQSDERKFIKLSAPLELALTTMGGLSSHVAASLAQADAVLAPLEKCHSSFDGLVQIFAGEVGRELQKARPALAEAGAAAAASLPSLRETLFGANAKATEYSYVARLLPPLREALNVLTRDVQVELNAVGKTVLAAVTAAGAFVEPAAAKGTVDRIRAGLERKPEPGAEVRRVVLADALEASVDSAFIDRAALKAAPLKAAANSVRLRVWTAELAAAGGAVAVLSTNTLGLTASETSIALGGLGGLAVLGAGYGALKWSAVRRRLTSTISGLADGAKGNMVTALTAAVKPAVLPLREAVSEARELVTAEKARLLDDRSAVTAAATELERLRNEVAALKTSGRRK